MALACTWGGFADTNVDFAEFFGGDHTVAGRFMLQHPKAYVGPMLSVSGTGRWFVGQGDYRANPGQQVKLLFRVGGRSLTHAVDLSAGTWHHLAVTRSGNRFRLHLDGRQVGGYVTLPGSGTPAGSVRLGKETFDAALDGGGSQFYGLLDDVAVFDRKLSAAEIRALSKADHLTGVENGLVAGYVFGYRPPGGTPAVLRRPLTRSAGARIVRVSNDRDAPQDARKLPLAATAFMHLPCRKGVIWEVSQGWEGHIGHFGYAAFCADFFVAGGPMDDSLGEPIRAGAPGRVDTIKPNPGAGPGSNYISIEQARLEFGDYLHLVDDSSEVAVGERVRMGRDLADMGKSGTPRVHLHFAVTNQGEGHKADPGAFVTIPAPYCNYEYSEDQGASWHRVIRGVPQRGQWVRHSTIRRPVRYSAVWEPSDKGEIQVYGWKYEDYRAKYDELWRAGWRLKLLSPYVVRGKVRYTAVWRPSRQGEIQVYGWKYEDYRAKYDELWPQGWRLKLLCPYVVNGKVRYTAVWSPSRQGEIQVYGWKYDDYRAKYDELWPQGWRLKLLCPYVVNGKVRYTAVWSPSRQREVQVYGWKYRDFRAKYDELWPRGWRLKLLCPYVVDRKVRYTAVWRSSRKAEFQVYGWKYEDYRAMYDSRWHHGWRLKLLSPYVV